MSSIANIRLFDSIWLISHSFCNRFCLHDPCCAFRKLHFFVLTCRLAVPNHVPNFFWRFLFQFFSSECLTKCSISFWPCFLPQIFVAILGKPSLAPEWRPRRTLSRPCGIFGTPTPQRCRAAPSFSQQHPRRSC